MYSDHPRLCVSVSVCLRPHAITLLHGPGCNLGIVGDAPSCALLGGFASGARVALLWQHSAKAKCQRVLVLALYLVRFAVGSTGFLICCIDLWTW